MSNRRMPAWVPFAAIGVAAPLLLLIEYGPSMTQDEVLRPLVQMTLTRVIAAAVFFVILLSQGYRVLAPFRKPFWRSMLVSLPAFWWSSTICPFSR